ncbi:hypothetical protein [Amycolatopsis sp. NPDC059021]|uniref:hypothetical protein n=1 Tax=Amycolatopsis sp. NPDC059021 TaxID=3346704 RepID=UPI00366B2EB4
MPISGHVSDHDRFISRRRCTGESNREIRRQLRTEAGPLMPSAGTYLQQILEAGLLVAACRAVDGVHCVRGTVDGQVHVIVKAGLSRHRIGLQVTDEALDHLLSAILPMQIDDEPYGVMGLRPSPARGHLDLVLREGGRTALARLHGVTRARWQQARDFVRDTRSPAIPFWESSPRETHIAEAGFTHLRELYPMGLMSEVLRRYLLLKSADWIDMHTVGDAAKVRWCRGPAATDVAAQLADPVCGIADLDVCPEPLSTSVERVVLKLPHRGRPRHGRQRA